jgi:hypothetical protein
MSGEWRAAALPPVGDDSALIGTYLKPWISSVAVAVKGLRL